MENDSPYLFIIQAEVVKSLGSYIKDGIIIRYLNGKFYSYHSECPHMPDRGNLEDGEFCADSLTIKCPEHNFRFSIESGYNVRKQLCKYGRLNILETLVVDGNLYVKEKIEQQSRQDQPLKDR